MPDRKLQIIPLGGLGEFGMNSMAIRYGDDIIVVDAGMMFPESELLGVDIVTPDRPGQKVIHRHPGGPVRLERQEMTGQTRLQMLPDNAVVEAALIG